MIFIHIIYFWRISKIWDKIIIILGNHFWCFYFIAIFTNPADTSVDLTNKCFEISVSDCNHCICVSHTGKENTVIRAKLQKEKVSVIHNAVDIALFTPDVTKRNTLSSYLLFMTNM